MEGLLAPGKGGPPSLLTVLSHSVIAAGSWYGVGGKMRARPVVRHAVSSAGTLSTLSRGDGKVRRPVSGGLTSFLHFFLPPVRGRAPKPCCLKLIARPPNKFVTKTVDMQHHIG